MHIQNHYANYRVAKDTPIDSPNNHNLPQENGQSFCQVDMHLEQSNHLNAIIIFAEQTLQLCSEFPHFKCNFSTFSSRANPTRQLVSTFPHFYVVQLQMEIGGMSVLWAFLGWPLFFRF